MPLPSKPLLLMALLALSAPLRADPAEDVFGRLYRQHLNAATGATAAAAQAAAALPAGPYRSAALSLQGWTLLQERKPAEAARAYQALLADPATPPALAELARRWLTRIDREAVREALAKAWTRDIQFPATLDALPAPPPPLKDRWNHPWFYKTRSLKKLALEAQRYDLQSTTLGTDSDLAAAVARPWPSNLAVRVVGLIAAGGSPAVTFETTDRSPAEKATLSEGKFWNGFTLVTVGPKALLLTDGDYVFLPLIKPGG